MHRKSPQHHEEGQIRLDGVKMLFLISLDTHTPYRRMLQQLGVDYVDPTYIEETPPLYKTLIDE